MPATRRLMLSVVFVLMCASTVGAQSWPAVGLAIRTNGSSFREGECVRVTLLALEDVPGPLVPQVRYEFDESLTVKSSAGQERPAVRRRVVDRPAGTPFDRFDPGASVVLDDTFCFGVGSAQGPYEVTVALLSGTVTTASLATCVEFQPGSAESAGPATNRCGFGMRGVSRRDDAGVLTLDGQFPSHGLFRLAFVRGDRLVHLLEAGLVASAPGELSFVVPPLGPNAADALDLVLQDQLQARSTTLAGVWMER